jgi:hypothetical protein
VEEKKSHFEEVVVLAKVVTIIPSLFSMVSPTKSEFIQEQ